MPEDVKDEFAEVIKFKPAALVRLVDPDDLVIDEAVPRWDQLSPGVRAAVPNPWREGEFLLGFVHGVPGQLIFVVGESFGQLEHVQDHGWVCNGLVQQRDVMAAVGANLAEKAKGSFTERLTRKAAKAHTSGTPTK